MTATDYIVVNDGAVLFPILRSNLLPGDSKRRIAAMDADQYAEWCNAVPMDDSHGQSGTPECDEFCDALIEAGAEYWEVA